MITDDYRAWLTEQGLWAGERSYDDVAKAWLARSGHYLDAPPPGALFSVAVCPLVPGLFGPVPAAQIVGLAVVGRPVARSLPQDGSWGELTRFARSLPQDGSWGELTRFALDPSLPKGTASRVLRVVCEVFAKRPAAKRLISYHDRSRHSGCIYKKAGWKKDGVTRAGSRRGSWATRPGREQAVSSETTSKRRWRWEAP